jgi:hypothetical protein
LLTALLLPNAYGAGAITQHEYLQWLVQLSGDEGQFSEKSTPNDYVTWARGRGMDPKGGWKLNAKLSRDVLAETLVHFLKLNPGKQSDYLRTLAKYQISLPDGPEVSRSAIGEMFGNSLEHRQDIFRRPKSPHKPDRDRDKDKDKDKDRDNDNRPGPPRDRDNDNGRGPRNNGPKDHDD